MVSRGGRSKGCSNCRRRRVKCDEHRPICIRCKKRGLECDGPKDATWINQNVANPKLTTTQRDGSVPDSLPFVAFEDDMCLAFTRKHLLRGGSVELACDKIQWYRGPDGYIQDPGLHLLRKAILSLSVTFFGSQNRQGAITNRGYRQYGDVLRQLNAHLAHSQLQTTDETILTAATCMLLEIFLPTGPANFLKHVRGIEAILEIRGPPTSAAGDSAFIINNLQAVSIIGALAEGRPSVWAKPEWKRIPLVFTDEGSVIRHNLWMVLADCSLANNERDRLFAADQDQTLQPLIGTANTMLEQLRNIYSQWEKYNETLEDDRITRRDSDLPIANHASATTYMLYNAACLCVLKLSHSIDPSPKSVLLRTEAATNIVQCLGLKYFQQREGSAEANTIGFVATKVAWEVLGGPSSPEGRRLSRIVQLTGAGMFAIGAWEHAPKGSDTSYPKLAHNTIQDLWNSPLWAEKRTISTESHVLRQREIIDIGARSTFWRSSTSSPCSTDTSKESSVTPLYSTITLPAPSFFRDLMKISSSASPSLQQELHTQLARVPGLFNFDKLAVAEVSDAYSPLC